ncbi:MAG: acyl-CoA dehydrogenase family protein [Oligoflexia bacterium]|nr:acyl-CoA dehydrogenase family protein [Oligoflexia bacterium]
MPNSKTPSLKTEASVAKSLFLGKIVEDNLFPFPTVNASEAETLSLVLDSIDKFMAPKEKEYREFDHKGAQPEDYIQELRELGLFGLIIPEDFGGLGLSNIGYSRVLQQTSRYDASTSLTIGAHSSIGMKGVLLFGNAEQRKKYLPKLASGEMIAAFCLTEPGSGSDAGSIKTNANQNPDGSWTLSGEKIWITNGAMAEFFTVFARTGNEHGKLTAFLVERNFGGIKSGPKEDKLGIRASATTTVSFENTVVPAANVLGEVGKGFKIAMSILNNGRTGLGGGCVGAMKRLIALSAKQAAERKQFGRPIAEFGLVKEKLAQMAVNCFASECAVTMVGHYIDSGVEDYSIEAAMSKIFASESLWMVAYEALQIAGGNGFMKEYPYELVMRDSRINMIFEGTNEILRLYVGLSGLKEAGEYLKEIKSSVGKIFNDPIKGFGVLSGYAGKRLSEITSLGREKLVAVHPALSDQAKVYQEYTQRLSKASDELLRRYGKEIIGMQFPTKRVAEVSLDLFVGLCVLSRVSKMLAAKGEGACKHELEIATIFTQQAKRRMNQNIARLISHEDDEMRSLADHITASAGYSWDIL